MADSNWASWCWPSSPLGDSNQLILLTVDLETEIGNHWIFTATIIILKHTLKSQDAILAVRSLLPGCYPHKPLFARGSPAHIWMKSSSWPGKWDSEEHPGKFLNAEVRWLVFCVYHFVPTWCDVLFVKINPTGGSWCELFGWVVVQISKVLFGNQQLHPHWQTKATGSPRDQNSKVSMSQYRLLYRN